MRTSAAGRPVVTAPKPRGRSSAWPLDLVAAGDREQGAGGELHGIDDATDGWEC